MSLRFLTRFIYQSLLFIKLSASIHTHCSSSVITIKDRILYESGCTKIIFEEGSQLKTLEDYALYRIANFGDITFLDQLIHEI